MKCKFKAGKFIGNNVFRLYNQLLCENVSYKHELIVRENSRIETGPLYITLMFKFAFLRKMSTPNVITACLWKTELQKNLSNDLLSHDKAANYPITTSLD